MTLWAPLMVNDHRIGVIEIRRLDVDTTADTCEYQWHVEVNGDRHDGRIHHTYADGALVLVGRVLAHLSNHGVIGGLGEPP